VAIGHIADIWAAGWRCVHRYADEAMTDSNDEYRVKVQIGDATVEVEGAQAGVVEIVRALTPALQASLGGSASSGEAIAAAADKPLETEPPPEPVARQVDIRSFFEQKEPSSNREAVAVAAFYLEHLAPPQQRQPYIDVETMREAFRQARYPLPGALPQALAHARTAGYLDPTGERGKYRLNPVGYNLVGHTLGAGGEEQRSTPRRRRSAPRKASKRPKTSARRKSSARPKAGKSKSRS
jgi:hypothetical protein